MKVSNTYRRYYAPLDVSLSLQCVTPLMPLSQTYDGSAYTPDREASGASGTQIRPVAAATASDGTWDDGRSNPSLANMVWYAYISGTWQDITTASGWSDKVSVDTSSTLTRGTLTIKKNVASNANVQLRFEADLVDYRTQELHHMVSNPVSLVTTDKGEDTYGIGTGDSDNILYNPSKDLLDEYDYKVAHGFITASDTVKNATYDGQQYDRTVPIEVRKGTEVQTSGYSLNLYRVEGTSKVKLSAGADNELVSLTLTAVRLDLRLITDATYLVECVVSGSVVAQKTFSVKRQYTAVSIGMMNTAEMSYTDTRRWQKAIVSADNHTDEYASRWLKMNWSTTATNGTASTTTEHQEGSYMEYELDDLGFGTSESDTVTDSLEYSHKEAYGFFTDESGNEYVDESGNYLIGN